MRLFLAIYPPKEYLDNVRDLLRSLDKEKRNILPVSLDQVHFTVRFIGANSSMSSKQKIAKKLLSHAGSYSKPEIITESFTLGFPRQHHPRVMFYNIEPTFELNDLVDTLHRHIRSLGNKDTILWKKKEAREYHITVARLKPAAVNNSTIRRVQELIDKIDIPTPPTFTPQEMYLVESTVTPRGPVYKRLERITL